MSLHAALTTGPGTSAAQLELTLKSSDVAILAAAHECLSWRLREWQRLHPAVVRKLTARPNQWIDKHNVHVLWKEVKLYSALTKSNAKPKGYWR